MTPDQQRASRPLTAGELVAQLGGVLQGDADFPVVRFQPLSTAAPGDAGFLSHDRYLEQLQKSQAGLVVLPPRWAAEGRRFRSCIVADNPYLFFAQASQCLLVHHRQQSVLETEVHSSAVVDAHARIGHRVRVGPLTVIGPDVVIGDDTDIAASVVIANGATLGKGCQVHAGVRIGTGVTIGDRAVLHSGVVLGSDGFGFAPQSDGAWVKIPQVGGVVIGDDVEIGANTVVDRGTLTDTRIGNGVKLDNLIQVAHNVEIGDHTAIAACVGIAGSARIGRFCQIGGAAGILGHLEVADHTVIGPMSLVTSSIETAGKYVGVYPLQPERDWEKSAVMVRRLYSLRHKLRS